MECLYFYLGLGRTAPDPTCDKTLKDGVVVPLGSGQPSDVKSSALLYNEYLFLFNAAKLERYSLNVLILASIILAGSRHLCLNSPHEKSTKIKVNVYS